MLELIAKYADDKGLTVRPGFTAKKVKWLINLSADGGYLGIQELGNAGKGNQGLELRSCQEFPANEMQSGGKAHPLVESLNVVTLLTKSPEEAITSKDEGKYRFFVNLLHDLGKALPEAAIAAKTLEDSEVLQSIRADLFTSKAKPGDKGTVRVGSKVLVDDSAVADWWIAKRSVTSGPPEGSSICLVTGKPVTPLPTHPKISGLGAVGGLAIGSSLISFDKSAFASFGLEQSANAAVSEEAAMRYRAGLNHLIATGERIRSVIVGFWFSKVVDDDEDPLAYLFEGDKTTEADAQNRMRKLLKAIQDGERPDLADCLYYTLTVSGAAGRVMIRDWQEGPFQALVEATNAWFDDLEIAIPNGANTINPPKFLAVAATTVRDLDDLEGPLETALWSSAIRRHPIPMSAVQGALRRTRIDILVDTLRPIRMGLLKAYVIRNTDHGVHMHPKLNPAHPEPAYQAGRLMAVLALIQYRALGPVNANIVQRFYPAASSTPALVFGRLSRLANFHLAKIGGGGARVLEKKLADIWARIEERLPKTFTLEEQTLFALGYYQQRAFDMTKPETDTADQEESEDAE